jgi:hypothetical protein
MPSVARVNHKKHTMKYAILLMLSAISCYGAESEKPHMEVAVVQLSRLTNDVDYEKVRLLNMDKDTVEAVKKISSELAGLKRQIIDVKDEVVLMEIQKQIEFNTRKLSILRSSSSSSREVNIQKFASEFIVKKFSGRFPLILQDSNSLDGRIIYKNIKVVDITDEAADAFRQELSERIGEKSDGPGGK